MSLLNIIKVIKEEVDVDRVVRRRNNHRVENVHSSMTCQAFPCMDNTCVPGSQGQGGGSWERRDDVGEDRQQEQEGEAIGSRDVQVLSEGRIDTSL